MRDRIEEPMLAVDVKLEEIKYPALASRKLDGVRALMVDAHLVTRNFKPVANDFVRNAIEKVCPSGADGELKVVGEKEFKNISGAIRRKTGEPNFVYNIFDFLKDKADKPYQQRMKDLDLMCQNLPTWANPILPILINNEKELLEIEAKWLAEGEEGVMLRSLDGPYKFGRSTVKEGYLLKFKRMSDAECKVIGFEEKMHNANEATKDALGHTTRSGHQENLIPTGVLGSLKVIGVNGQFKGVEFNLPGFNDAERKEIWDHRDKYLGQMVTYKYQAVGSTERPRFPIFKGFRDDI
jgi:DNA ligase-1